MEFLRNFMRNRYGVDQLGMTLLGVGVVLSMVFRFVSLPWLYLLTYLPIGIALFRILSYHIPKRAAENIKFLNLYYRFKRQTKHVHKRASERNLYLYIKCPHCRQPIRLPKGRGKLKVDCPACHKPFERKT